MSEIEFPTNRWPIDSQTEMTVEHFDDLRKAIFRRWKGLGRWPFCHEEYLDREMQYSDFDYFTYQHGGDGEDKHGIKGDNFSGHHYWQYYYYPGLVKDWIAGGKIGPAPSPTAKTPYETPCEHEGTWVYLGCQIRYQEGAGSDEMLWNVMPIWTPAWTFLPMDVRYWDDMDYAMRQQRQEINWWIAWYHWPNYRHSRTYPEPTGIDGTVFCDWSGNKHNPGDGVWGSEHIDGSWQPAFHHYQAAIDNLASQIGWGNFFDAKKRNYWPDPGEDQESYSQWSDLKEIVRMSWATKTFNGVAFPTCPADDYYGFFLQNRLDYFLWLAEEKGLLEVDTWLMTRQKTSDEVEWVVRPYWKMYNCDLDGEMSTHVLQDFKVVLELMKYIAVGHGYTGGYINFEFDANTETYFGCGITNPLCIAKNLWSLAIADMLTDQDGSDGGGTALPPGNNFWNWSWTFSSALPPGAYYTLQTGGSSSAGSGNIGIGRLALPGIVDSGEYSVLTYDALIKKHINMRSTGHPGYGYTHTCGAYSWTCCQFHIFCDANPASSCCTGYPGIAECSVQDCEFYVVASTTGIRIKSIGAHHCDTDYTYQDLIADLRGVTSGSYMYWVSGLGAGIGHGHTNSTATVNFRSSALEFDFSRVRTDL